MIKIVCLQFLNFRSFPTYIADGDVTLPLDTPNFSSRHWHLGLDDSLFFCLQIIWCQWNSLQFLNWFAFHYIITLYYTVIHRAICRLQTYYAFTIYSSCSENVTERNVGQAYFTSIELRMLSEYLEKFIILHHSSHAHCGLHLNRKTVRSCYTLFICVHI